MPKISQNLIGNVDLMSSSKVEGWVVNTIAPGLKCVISVRRNNIEIARGLADKARADLKSLKYGTDRFAFSINLSHNVDVDELGDIQVFAVLNGQDKITREFQINVSESAKKMNKHAKAYQSFDGIKGDSNSAEKLRRLRLPPLSGLSILDIGCNEGFFCNFAVKQGAKRVIGVDTNSEVIVSARAKTPEAEFVCASWWDLPDEKFDVIFFLSAIHYEKRQKEFLRLLCSHLTSNGILVLECGISNNSANHWTVIQRHDGALRYPSFEYLRNYLLEPFAATCMGRSVDQPGDPLPRYVFHATPAKPMALLVYGKSKSGKSVLGYNLRAAGLPVYVVDNLFHRIIGGDLAPKSALTEFVRMNGDIMLLDDLSKKLVDAKLSKDLADLILRELPLEARSFVVEGEVLVHREIRDALRRAIIGSGGIVWDVTRAD